MIRLVNPAAGALAAGVVPDKLLQLTLNEVLAPASTVNGVSYPEWDGFGEDRSVRPDFTRMTLAAITEYYSEPPQEGETEVWEIVNLTADAHPIHTHLTRFRLLNRQSFNVGQYRNTYEQPSPAASSYSLSGLPSTTTREIHERWAAIRTSRHTCKVP